MAERIQPMRRSRRTILVFFLGLLCVVGYVVFQQGCLEVGVGNGNGRLKPRLAQNKNVKKKQPSLPLAPQDHPEQTPVKLRWDNDDPTPFDQLSDEEKHRRSANGTRGRLKRKHGKESYEDGVNGKPFTFPPTDDGHVVDHCKNKWNAGIKKRQKKIEKEEKRRRQWEERLKQYELWLELARKFRLDKMQRHQILLNYRGWFIVLEDESIIWQVEPKGRQATLNYWFFADVIRIEPDSAGTPGFDYLLINMTRGLNVHVRPWIRKK